ncbi:MAG: GTPase ObgE [Patescibacteria group bacterium]
MFVDNVSLKIEAGKGGDGKTAFFPGRGGPSGGNGGRGGNIYAIVNTQLSNLNKYASVSSIKAENGIPGDSNRKTGANGNDTIIELPIGTTVIDADTKEEFVFDNRETRILLCRGGEGGLGNDALKSPTERSTRKAFPGNKGQSRNVRIVLKLIADYGFFGLPNAGKSTLLNTLTAAHVKTANYPFTTLEPSLGVLNNRVIADIPGLIEGASKGKGLGIKFLRHIEKVKLLLHTISSESDDVIKDFQTVMKEFEEYNPELAKKDMIVLLTKTDLIDKQDIDDKIKKLKKLSRQVYPISIFDPQSIENLKKILI